MFRTLGVLMILAAIAGGLGEYWNLKLPTVSWAFTLSRDVELLGWRSEERFVPWFGWFFSALLAVAGLFLLWRFWKVDVLHPMTRRRLERFRGIRRGYFSFWILVGLALLASFDQFLVGNEALLVRYEGKYTFPAFTRTLEKGEDYGLTGDEAVGEPNYRDLQRHFRRVNEEEQPPVRHWVVLPIWPYAPTNDTIPAVASEIPEDGYSGLATRLYDLASPERAHLRYKFRDGKREGMAQGWDEEGNPVYRARYKDDRLVEGSEVWTGQGAVLAFLDQSEETLYRVTFPPSDLKWANSPKHPLGTTSAGYDVVSYLYGGLQVNIQAALFYIPLVYFIGVTVGLLMGYFGGWFDLVTQRLIEILSNIPFLFLVIIVASAVPAQWKDRFGLYLVVALLAAFGWMGMTYLMRTAALKEKARDYIAACRVIGASTPRILFRHLLPNSISIVVTLIPFSVSGLILSLTALDYLGFGLPPKYATWGKLLKDGLENLSSPWLVSAAFLSLVILLVLVTFVGEAVREAFDPKKYTTYR